MLRRVCVVGVREARGYCGLWVGDVLVSGVFRGLRMGSFVVSMVEMGLSPGSRRWAFGVIAPKVLSGEHYGGSGPDSEGLQGYMLASSTVRLCHSDLAGDIVGAALVMARLGGDVGVKVLWGFNWVRERSICRRADRDCTAARGVCLPFIVGGAYPKVDCSMVIA